LVKDNVVDKLFLVRDGDRIKVLRVVIDETGIEVQQLGNLLPPNSVKVFDADSYESGPDGSLIFHKGRTTVCMIKGIVNIYEAKKFKGQRDHKYQQSELAAFL